MCWCVICSWYWTKCRFHGKFSLSSLSIYLGVSCASCWVNAHVCIKWICLFVFVLSVDHSGLMFNKWQMWSSVEWLRLAAETKLRVEAQLCRGNTLLVFHWMHHHTAGQRSFFFLIIRRQGLLCSSLCTRTCWRSTWLVSLHVLLMDCVGK